MSTALHARLCEWCREKPVDGRRVFCSRLCRQAAFRLRSAGWDGAGAGPGLPAGATFGYADPPYPKLSAKYYAREKSFDGEVDHKRLIASLRGGGYAGWALSTSPKALRFLLPMCPPGARVCAWVKPIGVPKATRGIHNVWEAVIVVGGRQKNPGVRDWLSTPPARQGGSLLGMVPGDKLDDLFPGSGAVSRAWREMGRWSTRA